MDLSLSPADMKFQKEVRDWIDVNFDADLRARMALSKNGYVDKAGHHGLWQRGAEEEAPAADPRV